MSRFEAFAAKVQPPWNPMYIWLKMLYGRQADEIEFFEYEGDGTKVAAMIDEAAAIDG